MTVCYIPLLEGKQIKPAALGLLKQAKKLDEPVTALIVHCGIQMDGIQLDCDEVCMIELSEDNWPITVNHLDAYHIFQKEREKEPVLLSASPLANEIAAGLAFKLNKYVVNNVIDAERTGQRLSIKKEIYHGKACLYDEIEYDAVITYDPAFLSYANDEVTVDAPVTNMKAVSAQSDRVQFIESKQLSWEEIGLTEANCVIGVGRGVYSPSGLEQMEKIEELADILNAPIGGSKVADELKIIPRERRIGSSGVSLDQADIYIAIGISGSSQHLDGIKNVKHILAINSDAAAPIFKHADIGIISPFEEVIPKLINIIKGEGGEGNRENTSHLETSV